MIVKESAFEGGIISETAKKNHNNKMRHTWNEKQRFATHAGDLSFELSKRLTFFFINIDHSLTAARFSLTVHLQQSKPKTNSCTPATVYGASDGNFYKPEFRNSFHLVSSKKVLIH